MQEGGGGRAAEENRKSNKEYYHQEIQKNPRQMRQKKQMRINEFKSEKGNTE